MGAREEARAVLALIPAANFYPQLGLSWRVLSCPRAEELDKHSRTLLALAMISCASHPARAQSPGSAGSSSPPATQPTAAPAQTGPDPSSPSQAPTSSTPPAASPAASPAWSVGPIDFSGELSGYYTYNANHPHNQGDSASSSSNWGNNLYNFNTQAHTLDLSFAKLAISHSPDPVGFELDVGFGRTIETINAGEPTWLGFKYIEQAYIDWKPAKAKGFELDFGKFSTSTGAEAIEEYNNWNYSHSLVFSWAIPYFLFGVRASIPVGKHFTGGFQLVNGWNNVSDDVNSGRTIGVTGALTYTNLRWNFNYHTGPMNQGTNTGFRHLFDTTLLLTPPGKLNGYLNFNYGSNKNSLCSTCTAPATQAFASWYGLGTAVHVQLNSRWSITARAEWFDDADGYELARALPTPISNLKGAVAQQVKEATVTAEYKLFEGLLWRAEWRHDWSTYPMFERGMAPVSMDESSYSGGSGSTGLPFNNPAGLVGYLKSQNTITIGLIAFFGPTR